MKLTIHIPPDTERRLRNEAARLGVDESEYAKRLIASGLPQRAPEVVQVTLDLLAQWDKEDETTDPNEIARRLQEFEELKAALNKNRFEVGGPAARRPFP